MSGIRVVLILAGGYVASALNRGDGVASLISTHVMDNNRGHSPALSALETFQGSGAPGTSTVMIVVLVPLFAIPLCLGGVYAFYTPDVLVQSHARDLRAQAADLRERAAALCSEASHVFTHHRPVVPLAPVKAAAPAGTSWSSTKRLFQQVGPVLPFVMLATFSLSTLEANQGWIRLNFYAHRHANLPADAVHCEFSPGEYYCRAALEDKAGASVILSFVPPVVQLLFSPALGASSDARGRRGVLVVCQLLSILPVLCTVLFTLFQVSLYLAFVMAPFAALPLEALCLAWVIDRQMHQADVMGAFGLVIAAKYASYLVGWILGNILSVKLASVISLVACLLATVYIMICLPESLPAKRRKQLERPLTMPGIGLRVWGRSAGSVMLLIIVTVSLFCDKGFSQVSQEYFVTYTLGWTNTIGSISLILDQVSSILWLCSLGALVQIFGSLGTVAFARWSSILCVVSATLAHRRWHVVAVHFLFTGPVTIAFPALAALCSTLVTPSEQGLMQGCVGAIASLAESLGPYVYFLVFDASRTKPKSVLATSCIVILHAAGAVVALLTLMQLKFHWRRQQQKQLTDAHGECTSVTGQA